MMSAPSRNLLWTDCNQRSCSKGSRVQFKANVHYTGWDCRRKRLGCLILGLEGEQLHHRDRPARRWRPRSSLTLPLGLKLIEAMS
jgi:hypothetical protein